MSSLKVIFIKNFQSTDLKLETLEAQASRLVRLYTNVLEKVE